MKEKKTLKVSSIITRMKFRLIEPPGGLKMIADAVDGLPRDERLVLSLRYVEELTVLLLGLNRLHKSRTMVRIVGI